MPSAFTYNAWDFATGERLDPLPYVGVSMSRMIDNPGSFQGALPVADERVQKLAFANASRTGRTLLGVDLGGTLIWSGIIWTRKYRKRDMKLVIGATETGSWLRSRLQAADYGETWKAGEQPLKIAERVINDALGVSTILGGKVSVVRHEEGSPPTVAASYPAASVQSLDSIIHTLSQMGYGSGFDYSFDVAYEKGTLSPHLTINLWFPRQGRTAAQTGFVLLDKDTLDWEYPEDSTSQANKITVTGSGGAGIVPTTLEAPPEGYPLLERTEAHSQIISEEILAELAFGDIGLSLWPIITPWIELSVPGPLEPGSFDLGDDLIFRVDPVSSTENSNPRFPGGTSFEWRITGWTLNVAEYGMSILHLDLNTPPLLSLPPLKPPL